MLGTDTTAPYTFTWTSVPAGSYSLTAQVVYDSGSTVASTAANVLVAASKPQDPPTITAISDQTTTESTPTAAIPFTIGDTMTAVSNLALYATSTDASIVPTNNIVFGGSDSNRTVTLTPVAGATGNVEITVFVVDSIDNLTTSTNFQLAVQVPSALTLSTTGQGTVSPDLSTQPLTPGQIYTVTAIPADGQEFAGWTGSISSSSPRLTFMLTSNLVLNANFVPSGSASAVAAVAGTPNTIYNGLFYESDAVA